MQVNLADLEKARLSFAGGSAPGVVLAETLAADWTMNSDSMRHDKAIVGTCQRHASAFDLQRSRALFEKPWFDRFLAAMPTRARVLDVGCGSGKPIAGYLIHKECSVTGVDTSASLLALCRGRFPGHIWLESDMRQLSLSDRFHGILAWDSFFHLSPEDQRIVLGIFSAHAADAGILMFTSGPEAGERISSFEGEPLYRASLAESEYRSLLNQHGFEVLEHVADDTDCAGHTVWLARRYHGGQRANPPANPPA